MQEFNWTLVLTWASLWDVNFAAGGLQLCRLQHPGPLFCYMSLLDSLI